MTEISAHPAADKLEASTLDRAIYYASEKVNQLRLEIRAASDSVQQGFGGAVLPFFGFTVSEWMEVLEADLLAAECDLETLNAERGAVQ